MFKGQSCDCFEYHQKLRKWFCCTCAWAKVQTASKCIPQCISPACVLYYPEHNGTVLQSLLLSHLRSSSQYSNQQSQYCGRSHITWSLSTPQHTKDQPADIWLLLHSWEHVHCTDLCLAALHSSLDHFSTHCSFCVIVLYVQLPWQQRAHKTKWSLYSIWWIFIP